MSSESEPSPRRPKIPPRAPDDDQNEIVGFEVDVASEIGRLLGVDVELVVVGSPDRIPFVALGKVDAVMGAMTRDSKRAKVIDFSVPIHTSSYGVLTRKDTGITTWQQLNHENITLVQVGAPSQSRSSNGCCRRPSSCCSTTTRTETGRWPRVARARRWTGSTPSGSGSHPGHGRRDGRGT